MILRGRQELTLVAVTWEACVNVSRHGGQCPGPVMTGPA